VSPPPPTPLVPSGTGCSFPNTCCAKPKPVQPRPGKNTKKKKRGSPWGRCPPTARRTEGGSGKRKFGVVGANLALGGVTPWVGGKKKKSVGTKHPTPNWERCVFLKSKRKVGNFGSPRGNCWKLVWEKGGGGKGNGHSGVGVLFLSPIVGTF